METKTRKWVVMLLEISENRTIEMRDMITYKTRVKKDDIPKLITFMTANLDALELRKCGSAMFREEDDGGSDGKVSVEIFIPVTGKVKESGRYGFAESFQIEKAISARHEGSFGDLTATEKELNEYISSHGYKKTSAPCYVFSSDPDTGEVIDIYIGVGKESA
ncbi:MAG: hypothetical protein J6M17_07120 [Ruminococcus sp.]|nr:hypothetical protein [Ruminococcus sp.]